MKIATTATVSKGTPATTDTTELTVKTKHLAAMFGIKATALRRVLRSMSEYADGVHTNYAWAENDKRIPAIKAKLETLAADKLARAKAAKDALDKRAEALAAAAKVDKVLA